MDVGTVVGGVVASLALTAIGKIAQHQQVIAKVKTHIIDPPGTPPITGTKLTPTLHHVALNSGGMTVPPQAPAIPGVPPPPPPPPPSSETMAQIENKFQGKINFLLTSPDELLNRAHDKENIAKMWVDSTYGNYPLKVQIAKLYVVSEIAKQMTDDEIFILKQYHDLPVLTLIPAVPAQKAKPYQGKAATPYIPARQVFNNLNTNDFFSFFTYPVIDGIIG
jgi:hypothetical protein